MLNSEHILKHSKVQELINDQEQQFDLVVADQDFHESFFLFAHKFKCPLVTVGKFLSFPTIQTLTKLSSRNLRL